MITSKASKRLSQKMRLEVEQEIREIRALLDFAQAQLKRSRELLALAAQA